MNKFKRFDLVDRVPEELWTEAHNIVQEAMTITIPKRRKCKKAKQLSERVLQIATKKKSERQGKMGKICLTEWRVSENSKER